MINWSDGENVWRDIEGEMIRQDAKWGSDQDSRLKHKDKDWALILGEEIGEVQKAVLEIAYGKETKEHLREELVQVAAVVVQWIVALDSRVK